MAAPTYTDISSFTPAQQAAFKSAAALAPASSPAYYNTAAPSGTPVPTGGPAFTGGQQPGSPPASIGPGGGSANVSNGGGAPVLPQTPSGASGTYVGQDGKTYDNATNQPIGATTPTGPQPSALPNTSGSQVNPLMPSASDVSTSKQILAKTAGQMGAESLDYQDKAVAAAQGLIDSIEKSFNTEISTAAGNAGASAAAAGFGGSPLAGQMTASAMQPAIEARTKAVADAINNIRTLAATQYQAFQTAETTNAENTLSLFQQAQTQVVSAATAIWASGNTPSELQQTNPDEYNYVLKYGYNGDVNAMNAAYVAAAQKNLMNNGQPVYQAGSNMVFGQYDGMNADGTPNFKFIPVTLPGDVPLGYKMQSNNQTTNGQVITTFAPVDSNGNIIYDPSQPNGGIVTQINGQTIGKGTDGSATINPILSGQTIGNTTLGTVPNGVSENAAVTGQGIIDGTSPPTISNSMSGVGTQVKSYLAANGFDLSKAALDWQAVSKYMTTLNSATQVRFRQAVMSVPPMLDNAQSQFDKLQTDMQGATTLPQGLKILNSTNLAAFASGAYGPQLQSDAVNLQNQITDVTSEVGVVFKGGNTATDLALQNGASMLSGSWDAQTFKDAINLIKQNMLYRKTAVLNAGVAGTTGDNTYAGNVSGGQTADTSASNTGAASMYPAGSVVEDAQGNKYTVGADGETLTPMQ